MADVSGSQGVAITEVEVEDSPNATVVVVSGVIPALALAGAFALVLMVLRARLRRDEPGALEILARRLARGEITPQQYLEVHALLQSAAETEPAAGAGVAADTTAVSPSDRRKTEQRPRRRTA
jgi:uncharacterized protein (DUF2336 family)